MPVYRFLFCNDLSDSTGHMFRACQRAVEVSGKATLEEAIDAAKSEFERQEGIARWTLRARVIECEELETNGTTPCPLS